ncbi:MAG TPA: biopolymer transporter ExbD [Niabella sp.]|nr:biopolymer transporter ExbD [Chitinophagaceae bacterium]HRN46777.1 biopolymer transporter ExbD [Niabella sp.]HRO84345.1 biopolymer transporter ExbD [Niabella sp.]HUN01761.1 biopolymer transporter ExbD [Niabella sp.]
MARNQVKKASTDTDMTPFVDVAFLILAFFIMATKFKPAEPVPITTPNSVSSQPLPDNNAVMISIDKDDKVYFSIMSKSDKQKPFDLIVEASKLRNIPLTTEDVNSYRDGDMIGMPFSKLKGFFDLPHDQQLKYKQEGIPVLDSATAELTYWIAAAKQVFAGEQLKILIKGDAVSKYPVFKAVVDALKKNDEQKYNLVTSPEEAPQGTDLYKERLQGKSKEAK